MADAKKLLQFAKRLTKKYGLTFAAWLIPVIISGVALFLAYGANITSHNALISSQRPRIAVEALKFDNGTYISLTPQDKKLDYALRFKLTNKGDSTAQNIRFTPITTSITSGISSTAIPTPENVLGRVQCTSSSGGIALEPDESVSLVIEGYFNLSNTQIAQIMQRYQNNDLAWPVAIELTYDSSELKVSGKVGQSVTFNPHEVSINYRISE